MSWCITKIYFWIANVLIIRLDLEHTHTQTFTKYILKYIGICFLSYTVPEGFYLQIETDCAPIEKQGGGIWKDGKWVMISIEKVLNQAYVIRTGQQYKAESNQATEAFFAGTTAYETFSLPC